MFQSQRVVAATPLLGQPLPRLVSLLVTPQPSAGVLLGLQTNGSDAASFRKLSRAPPSRRQGSGHPEPRLRAVPGLLSDLGVSEDSPVTADSDRAGDRATRDAARKSALKPPAAPAPLRQPGESEAALPHLALR